MSDHRVQNQSPITYLGNNNIKRDGVDQEWTQETINEYAKCLKDPVYFAENYVKVISLDDGLVPFNLYPYQREMVNHFNENRFSIVLACRQSGKCQSINGTISIKHRGTGEEQSVTFGEFYEILSSNLDSNNERVEPERKTEASALETTRATNNTVARFDKNDNYRTQNLNNRSVCRGTKLSDTVERKFIESLDSSEYLIWTDTGWEKLDALSKTVEYEKYIIKFSDGSHTEVADTHIFFDSELNEVFAKDCKGLTLYGEFENKEVIDVTPTGVFEHMYDVSINSVNHRYYSDGVLSHNSITSCAYLLWYAIFYPEKIVAILANKGATAKEMLGRITLMLENLPFFLQPGCKVLNKTSIEFSNNSKIISSSTSSSSIRGLSVSLLFLDEFAFVNNDSEFYTSTYPVISSGKDTKILITSTPNGIGNVFHKLWEGAVQKTNNFHPFTVNWWDVPGRDEKWKQETIANTSEIQFKQEYDVDFIGSGNTLISGDKLLQLKAENPIYEQDGVKVYDRPNSDSDYMMFVDVAKGRGQDYSTFNLIDVSARPFRQVAVFRDNKISPLLFPDIIYKYARTYNDAYVVIESNDAGQVVCNGLYHELEYENVFVESAVKADSIGVTMTRRIKRIGTSTMKDLIEQDQIRIRDTDTILELSTFIAKGSSYEASNGNHDDLVMNLVLFGWFTTTPLFVDYTDVDVKKMLYEEQMKMIEDDVTPFGFMDDGQTQDYEVIQGDVWTTVDDPTFGTF